MRTHNVSRLTTTQKRVQRILAAIDWGAYWQQVSDTVLPEIEAYEQARRRSLKWAHDRVFR